MKTLFFISFLLLLYACSNQKKVYWCGDHACVNTKDKELYFKKTMTVELKKHNYVENTNTANNNELAKQILLEEKNRKKEDKKLAKQKLKEEKNRKKEDKKLAKQKLKEEEKLAKQKLLNEKKRNKKEKKTAKKVEKNESKKSLILEKNVSNKDFNKILEIVTNRNMFRPFPDINDIPN